MFKKLEILLKIYTEKEYDNENCEIMIKTQKIIKEI